MLIAVGSVKGSPGATTFAVALAACWPGRPVVLVEADPAGGDLGGRFGVPDVPGLAGLAVAARRGPQPDLLLAHTHRLPFGVDVVIAPASGRRAAAALAELTELTLRPSDVDVVVDVGRLYEGSPAGGLAMAADALLVVSRPDIASVDHTAAFTSHAANAAGRVSVVVVGDGPFRPRELAAAFGVELAVQAPTDRRGAAVLNGAARAGRGWDRVGLPAAARAVAVDLLARAPAPAAVPAEASEPQPQPVAAAAAAKASP